MTVNRPHLARRIPLALLVLFLLAGGLLAVAVSGPSLPVSEPAPGPEFQRVSIDVPDAATFEAEQRAAFLADLLGPGTDVTPEQADQLVELAHRVCDLLGDPTGVPAGAEIPTRESIATSLVASGWTASEAGKLLDTAAATYCARMLTAEVPAPSATVLVAEDAPTSTPHYAPSTPAQAPAVAPAPAAVPAPAPVGVEQVTPAAEPAAPTCGPGEELQGEFGCVAVQLPEEAIGGARCPDPLEVVVAIAPDGSLVCGVQP